jgi:hypothetical protein
MRDTFGIPSGYSLDEYRMITRDVDDSPES